MTLYHVTPLSNLDSILRTGLQPQIGEHSLSAGETVQVVYLFTGKENLEQAMLNWAGDMFGDEEIAYLEIQIPLEYEKYLRPNGFETKCEIAIPPQYIQVIDEKMFD